MAERRPSKTEPARSFERLPLNALRVFEAVATRGGFAAAAESLHVTPAAVSMQVRALEDYLQVPLFQRTGRAVTLTAEGATLLPGVRRGLAELQQAMQHLKQARDGGTLKLSLLASFLQKWLLPRLPELRSAHPDLELQLHTSDQPVAFTDGGYHAAIRLAAGPTPGLYAEHLLDDWYVLVGSPALLARHGPVRTAADLRRYPLLRSTDEAWTLWADPATDDWHDGSPAFDHAVTLLAAAEQGDGLALTRWTLAAHDLAAGRIVRASERAVRYPRSYWFVCPEGTLALPKVQRLLGWLRAASRAFASPADAPPASPAAPANGAAKGPALRRRRPASRGRAAR